MIISRRNVHALCLGLLLLAVFVLVSHPAFAQNTGSAGTFSCTNGQATGSLYQSPTSCPVTLQFSNVFSFLVCNMEQLSSHLLGNMFCGMINALTPAVSAVLVMAVLFFGVSFTIGLIPATAREFQMFLFKVAFVWAFATQSDYLIGIGYSFFINGIRDGVAIALTGYSAVDSTGQAVSNGPLVYTQLDSVLATMIHYATDYVGLTTTTATGTSTNVATNICQNAIFAVMAVMGIAFPPIFLMAVGLIAKLAVTFVRAIFGYIYALVGIAFLLTLAPFFLSFSLFRQTRPFFDKWTGYLVSFALQIVILFAFISFILSINVKDKTDNIASIIMPSVETKETTSFRAPWEYCTLCDFQVVDKTTQQPLADTDRNYITNGMMKCKTPKTPIPILSSSAPNPDPKDPTKMQIGVLFKFSAGTLFALLVLAIVVEGLLDYVGILAQTLAGGFGGTYAAQLGGGRTLSGRSAVQMPGNSLIDDFQAGFEGGYRAGSGNTSIGASYSGVKEGFKAMIEGREVRTSDGPETQGGLRNNFLDWLTDPNQISDD